MILIGRDLSPFTRRIVISLKTLGIPFERRELSVLDHGEQIRAINPLERIPALILAEGEPALVDSWAILDYVDQLAGPERALIPASGKARQEVLRLVALGMGTLEKGVSSFYERVRRPQEKTYEAWVERCDGQALSGLAALDAAAEGRDWLHGERMTQADITAAVTHDFLGFTNGELMQKHRFPHLEALVARCQALSAFRETSLERFRT